MLAGPHVYYNDQCIVVCGAEGGIKLPVEIKTSRHFVLQKPLLEKYEQEEGFEIQILRSAI